MVRSGHHGVIQWMHSNINKRLYFFDDIHLCDGDNVRDHKLDVYGKNEDDLNVYMYNMENFDFSTYGDKDWSKYSPFIPRKVYEIIVLRDPFNMMASIIKGKKKVKIEDMIELWINQAKQYLTGNFININFDKWFSDDDYKKTLSEQLDLDTHHKGIHKMFNTGKSSFDKDTSFSTKANTMDVLNRWKTYINKKEYRDLFTDEVISLSRKIFGEQVYEIIDSIQSR